MDFTLENPFAYPLLPGVSLMDDWFSTSQEDILRLPLYDLPPDMGDQLLQQDVLHESLLTSVSTDSRNPQSGHHAVSRNLVGPDNMDIWEAATHPWRTLT